LGYNSGFLRWSTRTTAFIGGGTGRAGMWATTPGPPDAVEMSISSVVSVGIQLTAPPDATAPRVVSSRLRFGLHGRAAAGHMLIFGGTTLRCGLQCGDYVLAMVAGVQ
jgi:hypothetical protein